MENDVTVLIKQVLTLEWASWAVPISILAALVVRRLVPVLLISAVAVVVHYAAPTAMPAVLGGESITTVVDDLAALATKLQPAAVLVTYVGYVFLIFVFSLTRRDMFRPGVTE